MSQASNKPLLKQEAESIYGATIEPSDTLPKLVELELPTGPKEEDLSIHTSRLVDTQRNLVARDNKILPEPNKKDEDQFKHVVPPFAKDEKYLKNSTLAKEEAEFDIFNGKLDELDRLQRVKADYLVANNKITPFDSSKFIQTLFVPV